MNSQPELQRQRWLNSIVNGSSIFCMGAGGLVLVGWMFDLPALKGIVPGWATMKANTAVCFVLGALSLWLLREDSATGCRRRWGRACAAIVGLVALLTAGEDLLQADLGIDQLLFQDSVAHSVTLHPGRMSVVTAFGLVFIAVALLGLDWRTRRGHRPVFMLPLVVGAVGLMALTGYLYDVKELYTIGHFASMAMHTALLFVVLAAGVLCARRGLGPIGILTGEGVGGVLARRLLPLTVGVPLLFGWLRLLGERAGLYGLETGLLVFATVNVLFFSVVVWLTAVSLNRAAADREQAEAAGREAGRFAQSTIDALSALVCVVDAVGTILATNAAWRHFAETNPPVRDSVQVGANYLAVCEAAHGLSADGAAVFASGLRGVIGGEQALFTMEYPCHAPTEQRWFEGRVTRFPGDGPVRVVVAHENITQRKQAETKLKGSEAQYRRLFEAAKDGILILNAETGRIEDVNPFLITLLGFSRERLLHREVWDLGFFTNLVANREKFEELKRVGYVRYEDLPLETAAGLKVDVEFVSNVYEVNGAKVVQCNIRNITERKRVEQALREKEHLLSESQRLGHVGSWFYDGQATMAWSEEMHHIFGVDPTAFTPGVAPMLGLILPEDRASMQAWIAACAAGQKPAELEFRITWPDGSVHFILGRGEAVHDAASNFLHMAGTALDITERRWGEAALRTSEEEFRSLAESMPQIVWITRPDGGNIYFNRQWVDYTGLTLEQSYGDGWHTPFHPEDKQRAWEAWQNAIQHNTTYALECRLRRADGAYRWWLVRGVPLRGASGEILKWFGTCTDIDDLKRGERSLRLQAAALTAAANQIVITTRDGNIHWVNPAFTKTTGYTLAEVVGRNPRILKSGKQDKAFYQQLWDTILRGEVWHGELVNRRKDQSLYTEESTITPVKDGQGEITHFVAIKQDITARKQLEAEFLRSQRMEGIGALAGGIAHDLNNALAPILMSAEFLKMANKDPDQCRVLDTIYDCAQRGANMVKQIVTFARGSEGLRGVVQPRHLVQEMIDLTRHTFPAAIQIRTAVAANIWTLPGNPTQLHQILLNLCVNARDAMPTGGTLTLAGDNVRLSAADAELSPDAKPGPYVVLTVRDTGTGMTPEVRARLFEAFFTTKEPGKGTGLGLATVHNIAKDHGGFITVDSAIGRGTTFKVYLPAQPDSVAVAAAVEQPALPMGQGELILVVDDEAVIRNIATQTLEAFGYRVVTASDGAQAVVVCAQHLAGLQLLITDMSMPIMDGKMTIRAIHILLPRLPVIVASGSESAADSPLLKELDVQAFLAKPYSADNLIRTVHEVLHRVVQP